VHQIAAHRKFASTQFQEKASNIMRRVRENLWESFPAMSEKHPRNANSFS
jgi:hypothetical protein